MSIYVPDNIKNGLVGPQNLGDGTPKELRLDNYGAVVAQAAGPDYMELVRRGYVFTARTATAAAIPVITTATNAPTLWNKADSNKLVVPLFMTLSQATMGTYVMDGFTLAFEASMGSSVAVGQPFATFTNVAPVTNLIGSGLTPLTFFAGAVVTWTAQPTSFMDIGMGQYYNTGAVNASIPYTGFRFDFHGAVMMKPGTAIALGACTAASSATYFTTIVFAELPMVAGI